MAGNYVAPLGGKQDETEPIGHHQHGSSRLYGHDDGHDHNHDYGHDRIYGHLHGLRRRHWCSYTLWTIIGLIALTALIAGLIILGNTRSRLIHLESVHRFCLEADGDQVEPGPGDPNGFSFGPLVMDIQSGGLSWNLIYSLIAEPNGMNIRGPLSESDPDEASVFIPLNANSASGSTGTLQDTIFVDPALFETILANPSLYYVQIDNGAFPSGALRAGINSKC